MVGRQLARVSALKYGETLWSDLFEGRRHTVRCLKPAVQAVESLLELSQKQRKRVVWRIDGGGGSDENLNWLLDRDYHLVAKGKSNRRAIGLAEQAKRWDPRGDAWLAEVPPPVDWGHPIRFFVKRRWKKECFHYSYYVTSIQLPSKPLFMSSYDQRGGAEVEQFRNDKSGLALAARRKRLFPAQKALILLNDVAHNLLADFQAKALVDTKFAGYGSKRIVRDLLNIPGHLGFVDGQLVSIELRNSNELSKDLIFCLEKYCSGD